MGASLIIGSLLTAGSMVQQKKAAKKQAKAADKQRQAQKVQQRIADVRAGRERRQQMAQARVLQAQQVAGGFGAGIGSGSSAVQGAFGAVGSQAAGNVAFSQGIQGMSGQVSALNIDAAGLQSGAATNMAYSNMFQQGASIFSGPTFGNTPGATDAKLAAKHGIA